MRIILPAIAIAVLSFSLYVSGFEPVWLLFWFAIGFIVAILIQAGRLDARAVARQIGDAEMARARSMSRSLKSTPRSLGAELASAVLRARKMYPTWPRCPSCGQAPAMRVIIPGDPGQRFGSCADKFHGHPWLDERSPS